MVPNKINKEKLKLNKAQLAGSGSTPRSTPSPKSSSKKKELSVYNSDDLKAMVGGCCVCADDAGYSNNLLVYCDGCDVAVHQMCYGIISIPEGDWFCRRCEFKKINEGKTDKIFCQLCPVKEGAVKRTETNKWAHVVCALYIPEITFGHNRTMEPIITRDIHVDRLGKKCSICEPLPTSTAADSNAEPIQKSELIVATENKTPYLGGHVYVNCNKGGCKEWFHVTCAQSKGLLCEDNRASRNNVSYCIYCRHHYSKLSNSDIKRIPPFIAEKSSNSTSSLKQSKSKRKDLPASSDKPRKHNNLNNSEKKSTSNEPTTEKKSTTKANRSSRSNSLNNSITDPPDTNITATTKKSNDTDSQKSKKQKILATTNTSNPMTKTSTQIKPEKSEDIKSVANITSKSTKKIIEDESIKKEKQPQQAPTIMSVKKEGDLEGELLTSNKIENIPTVQAKLSCLIDETASAIVNKIETEISVELPLKPIEHPDVTECNKRKLDTFLNEDNSLINHQLSTPSSSYSSCSSNYSNHKSLPKDLIIPTPNLIGIGIVKPDLLLLPAILQTTIPLTPPPSVTPEHFLSSGIENNKFTENFKPTSNLLENLPDNTHLTTSLNPKMNEPFKEPVVALKGLPMVLPSLMEIEGSDDMSDMEDEGEFPKSLEDLLKSQWKLGSDLITEQSQNFDVMQFVRLLNDCKKENEQLEKKLCDLENSHTHLLNVNEKLQEPLNNKQPEPVVKPKQAVNNTKPAQPTQDHIQQKQVFQPISSVASNNLPKTPTKQSINSILFAASPISSASSPNNSSLQNISFASPQKSTKNNNNNFNAKSDFYNFNNKQQNGIKLNNNSANYASNQVEQPGSAEVNRYAATLHQNSQGHNQHILSALNGSPSKNTSGPVVQNQQHHNLLYQMNPYQQQLYYAYLMQQQQQGGTSSSFSDNISHMISGMNASGLGTTSNSTSGGSISNASGNNSGSIKSIGSMSKEILESTLTNMISNSLK